MKFIIGDTANGVEMNEMEIETDDYVSALERVVEETNHYCRPIDDREAHEKRIYLDISMINEETYQNVLNEFKEWLHDKYGIEDTSNYTFEDWEISAKVKQL